MDATWLMLVTAFLRLLLAGICYRSYRRSKSQVSLTFTVIFLLSVVTGAARFFAVYLGSTLAYFLYVFTLLVIAALVFHILALLGERWVKKTHAVGILFILSFVLAFVRTFVDGGVVNEAVPTVARLLVQLIPPFSFVFASFAFWKYGTGLNPDGRFFIEFGFLLLAVSLFSGYWLAQWGWLSLIILLNAIGTMCVAVGWLMCVYDKKNVKFHWDERAIK